MQPTNMNDITLRSRAMLVTLNISVWNPKKMDKSVTLDTLLKHNASKNAGAFIKNLLPDGAIDPIKKLETKIRASFYKWTLPWRDDGIRILPTPAWADFSAEERALRGEFDAAVGDFLLKYDSHRAAAKLALNGMFREADYPCVEGVRGRFAVRVNWFPLPDSSDFRVDLPEDVVAEIGGQINASVAESINVAQQDLRNRLSKAVGNVVDRLSDPDNIFRDSLITNLRDLCVQLPKLNVAGDEELERMIFETEKIACLSPDDLRSDDKLRKEAHSTAEDILSAMGIVTK